MPVRVLVRQEPGTGPLTEQVIAEHFEWLSRRGQELLIEECPVDKRPDAPNRGYLRASIRRLPAVKAGGIWRAVFKADWRMQFLIGKTRPHVIGPSHTSASGEPELQIFLGSGGPIFRRFVKHPGTKASHFVAQAVRRLLAEGDGKFKRDLSAATLREIAEAGKR